MSQTPALKITMEEKSQVLKFFEQYKDKLSEVPKDVKDVLQSINNHLWDIKKSDTAEYQDKLAAFELIEKVHLMLGKKFDPTWKPREPNKGGPGKAWTATKQQRIQNCNELKEYLSTDAKMWNSLSPFEQAQVLALVWGSVKQ